MRRPTALVALAIAALVLTGCGGDGSGITASASRRLQREVDTLRAAAASGDRAAAQADVARLEESVRALRADGGLSERAAARVDAALAAVRDRTALLPAPTTTTTTTTTTAKRPHHEDEPHDKGTKRGRGHAD